MRRAILLALASLLATSLLVGQPRECLAGYCPSYPCFGPCGLGCLCMAPPNDYDGGTCFSAQAAPHLAAKGWSTIR